MDKLNKRKPVKGDDATATRALMALTEMFPDYDKLNQVLDDLCCVAKLLKEPEIEARRKALRALEEIK